MEFWFFLLVSVQTEVKRRVPRPKKQNSQVVSLDKGPALE